MSIETKRAHQLSLQMFDYVIPPDHIMRSSLCHIVKAMSDSSLIHPIALEYLIANHLHLAFGINDAFLWTDSPIYSNYWFRLHTVFNLHQFIILRRRYRMSLLRSWDSFVLDETVMDFLLEKQKSSKEEVQEILDMNDLLPWDEIRDRFNKEYTEEENFYFQRYQEGLCKNKSRTSNSFITCGL